MRIGLVEALKSMCQGLSRCIAAALRHGCYLGFAPLVPLPEVFRRLALFLVPSSETESFAHGLVAVFAIGVLVGALVALLLAIKGNVLSLHAKTSWGIAWSLAGIAGIAIAVAGGFSLSAVPIAASVSFAMLGIGSALLNLGWLEAYAADGTLRVVLYASLSICIGNLVQGPIAAWFGPRGLIILSVACIAAAACSLIFLAVRRSERDGREQARVPALGQAGHGGAGIRVPLPDAAAVGFALCFYPWTVAEISPHDLALWYTRDFSALIYVASDVTAIFILALFSRSLRGVSRYERVRQRARFLFLAFAVFAAYFSFIRMLGLSAGGVLEVLFSTAYNIGFAGFWTLFIALVAMRQRAQGVSAEQAGAPGIMLAAVLFLLGVALHALCGESAAYFLVVFETIYILTLLASLLRRAPGDDELIAQSCAALAQEHGLSGREAEILLLIAQNHTVECIAQELCISIDTVRTHKKRIYAKLGVHKYEDLANAIHAARQDY